MECHFVCGVCCGVYCACEWCSYKYVFFYNMPIMPYFLPYYLLRLFFTYSLSVEIGKCKIWTESFDLGPNCWIWILGVVVESLVFFGFVMLFWFCWNCEVGSFVCLIVGYLECVCVVLDFGVRQADTGSTNLSPAEKKIPSRDDDRDGGLSFLKDEVDLGMVE